MRTMFFLSLGALAGLTAHGSAQSMLRPQASDRAAQLFHDPVWIVDAAGQGDFLDLQAAVQVALPESLILVRSGTYTGEVTISGKSLKIFADTGATVRLNDPLSITGIGADQRVTLSGLEFVEGFLVDQCVGPILFQDCSTPPDGPTARAPFGLPYFEFHFCGVGQSRQRISQSQAVTMVNCAWNGADGSFMAPFDGAPGQHGLWVQDSQVALYGCTLNGGDGEDCTMPPPFNVGGGSGGDGLQVQGATSWVWMTRTTLSGGEGGLYSDTGGASLSPACDGSAMRALDGSTIETGSHPDLAYHVPAVLRAGELGWHTVQGPAGSFFTVGRSPSRGWMPLSVGEGIQHLGRYVSSGVGPLQADGSLHRPFMVKGPSGRRSSIAVEMQGFTNLGGLPFWSEPRLLVVVHPGL